MAKVGFNKNNPQFDLIIIGAGPAGIAASLNAKNTISNLLHSNKIV